MSSPAGRSAMGFGFFISSPKSSVGFETSSIIDPRLFVCMAYLGLISMGTSESLPLGPASQFGGHCVERFPYLRPMHGVSSPKKYTKRLAVRERSEDRQHTVRYRRLKSGRSLQRLA